MPEMTIIVDASRSTLAVEDDPNFNADTFARLAEQ